MKKTVDKLQFLHGGNANSVVLTENQKNHILESAEPFFHEGLKRLYIGDGVKSIAELPYSEIKENLVAIGYNTQSDPNSVSIGKNSSASYESVSIGINSSSDSNSVSIGDECWSGAYSVAIGHNCQPSNDNDTVCSIRIGSNSYAIDNAIALGVNVGANYQDSVVLGLNSSVIGSNSISIGLNAEASNNAIAVGVNSKSVEGGVISIGENCVSSGADVISIGTNCAGERDSGIAIGTNCWAKEKYEIAIGTNCSAKGTGAIAIGTNCTGGEISPCILVGDNINSGSSKDSIMIGYSVFANSNGVSIGNGSNSSGEYGISIGTNSEARNTGGVSVGFVAKSSVNSVSIGTKANSQGEDSISIGYGAYSTDSHGISIGSTSHTLAVRGISIGECSTAKSFGSNGIAIGTSSFVNGSNGIAIGNKSSVYGSNGISIGTESSSRGDSNIILGQNCSTYTHSKRSILIGKDCVTYGENGVIAIGDYVNQGTVYGSNAVAIGTYITHFDGESVAIGHGAGSNAFGVALGFQATVLGDSSVALGQNARVSESNTIRLGADNLSKLSCHVQLSYDSDTRDKTDISTIPTDKSLKFINSIDPIRYVSNNRSYYPVTESTKTKKKCSYFEYDVDEHKKATNKGQRGRVGVKAQQVYKNLQDIFGSDNYANIVDDDLYDLDEVPSDRESKLTVAYDNFVPLLIGSIKELSKLVSNLQKEVDSLKEKLNSRDSDVGDTQTIE